VSKHERRQKPLPLEPASRERDNNSEGVLRAFRGGTNFNFSFFNCLISVSGLFYRRSFGFYSSSYPSADLNIQPGSDPAAKCIQASLQQSRVVRAERVGLLAGSFPLSKSILKRQRESFRERRQVWRATRFLCLGRVWSCSCVILAQTVRRVSLGRQQCVGFDVLTMGFSAHETGRHIQFGQFALGRRTKDA